MVCKYCKNLIGANDTSPSDFQIGPLLNLLNFRLYKADYTWQANSEVSVFSFLLQIYGRLWSVINASKYWWFRKRKLLQITERITKNSIHITRISQLSLCVCFKSFLKCFYTITVKFLNLKKRKLKLCYILWNSSNTEDCKKVEQAWRFERRILEVRSTRKISKTLRILWHLQKYKNEDCVVNTLHPDWGRWYRRSRVSITG